jgi:putative endonuclease
MVSLGELGEQVTAQWLQNQGWDILASRWRCRWGELDLVAYDLASTLIFVEVKTRQSNNWDADGLLAITSRKQQKLYRTAQMFLSAYPQFSELACRFDLALVKARWLSAESDCQDTLPPINLNSPISWQGYELTLTTYLEGID